MRPRFSPAKHVPHYSKLLWQTLRAPTVAFFVVAGNFFLLVAIAFFYQFEKNVNAQVDSWLDALWWGVSTITTVGYGDIVPVTMQGRIIGLFLMLSGVLFFIGSTALVIGIFTARTSKDILESEQLVLSEHEQIMAELARLRASVDELQHKLESSREPNDGLGE